MTEKEAVEALNSCACNWYLEEALDMAVEALKKQIKEKPIDRITSKYDDDLGFCPNCGDGINDGMNFCSTCGQAIDWSIE